MEWPFGVETSDPFMEDAALYGLLSSPSPLEMEGKSTWTFDENKLFENAIAEIEPNTPGYFENIATRIPWKSIDDIKSHYEELVHDNVQMIEAGHVPIPEYREVEDEKEKDIVQEEEGGGSKDAAAAGKAKKDGTAGQNRKRGCPWTVEEHKLFLTGLEKYGRGDWRSISRFLIITKTPTQVASHAQKYFRRLASLTPAEKRRPSIHDIKITPSTSVPPMPAETSAPNVAAPNPFMTPWLNNNYDNRDIVGPSSYFNYQ